MKNIEEYLGYAPETGKIFCIKKYCHKIAVGQELGCLHDKCGRKKFMFAGKRLYVHRTAWKLFYGVWPNKKFDIDHINKDPSDNRIKNLRICTRVQNNCNTLKKPHNTSGFKGVDFHTQNKKWRARIRFNNKEKHLGCFLTKEEAAKAYQEAAKKIHGEFARW